MRARAVVGSLLGIGQYSSLSIAVGLLLTLTGLITGLVFGVPGLIFTSVLVVMGVFVVAVTTSPRRRGDGDGGPANPGPGLTG